MKYFYDTEFIEDGRTIDLVSIGIVAEDGREYYAQSVEFHPAKASDWVKENVLAHLEMCAQANITVDMRQPYINQINHHRRQGHCANTYRVLPPCPWRTREQIKADILAFMDIEKYGTPELWAYYADYDHVVFCQLFGTMMDLPPGFPMYTRDIKQWADQLDVSNLPEQEKDEHNALADARHNRVMWEHLDDVVIQRSWED